MIALLGRLDRLDKIILFAAFITLVGHALGHFAYFYETVFEFDSLVHLAGGMFAGSIGMLMCNYLNRCLFNLSDKKALKVLLASYSMFFALAIGAIWEIYQCYFLPRPCPLPDTILDLIMDLLGGGLAAFYNWQRE